MTNGLRDRLVPGLWAGFYVQCGHRYPQRLNLEFSDGIVRGDGVDGIGAFTVDGEYRIAAGDVRLGWIKTYDGGHSVLYLGALEDNAIAGHWCFGCTPMDRFSLSPPEGGPRWR